MRMWGGRQAEPAREPRRRRTDLDERRSQRLYVIAIAGLAAFVPLILFAGFWVRSELSKGQRDVEIYLTGKAGALSRRIDAEVEQNVVTLRAISALPSLDGDAEGFGPVGERLLAAMPHWSALALVDVASGRVATTTRPGWPSETALKLLPQVGETRAHRIESEAGLGTGGQDVMLYVPVVRDGTARSVLVSALKSADLQQITDDHSRDYEGLLSLADGGNRLLTRSSVMPADLGQDAGPSLKQAAAERASGMVQATSMDGRPITSAFVRSPVTGWTSAVSLSQGQIDRMSTRSVWATIAAGTLSLILAGILIVFIVHTVLERRVSSERLSASRALGDLDARLLATTQEALTEQRKASSEREVLLREIYHRVKNNLQIVQSLLRLGSRDLRPDQREPFEAAVRRVGAMARVHTLLYNSPDLASIDFKDYLDELLKELSEGFGAEERQIASQLSAQSMRVPLDTAVPLAFIAVEILTNSFRHAFPEGRSGKITVEIGRDEPFGTLRIEDDGIGFKDGPGSKRRLGLTIVRKLVQQIGGAIEEPQAGSSAFVIRFPLTENPVNTSGPVREATT